MATLKILKSKLAALALATFAAATLAPATATADGVPVKWTADTWRVRTQTIDAYHGETLDLAAALTAYGKAVDLAGKTARLWWTTNVTALTGSPIDGAAYFETNATVTADSATPTVTNVLAAVWRGAYDAGTERVAGFIGVTGEIYRAAFSIRFRPSPGFAPSLLPVPTRVLDFATTEVANADSAPFVVKGGAGGIDAAAATNIAAGVTSNVVTKGYVESLGIDAGLDTNAVVALVSGAAVTNAGAVAAATNLAAVAAAAGLAEKRDLTNMVVIGYGDWKGEAISSHGWNDNPISYSIYKSENNNLWYFGIYGETTQHGIIGLSYGIGFSSKEEAENATVGYAQTDDGQSIVTRSIVTTTLATTADLAAATNAAATKAEVAAVSNSVVAVSNEVATFSGYINGELVRISITNYYGNTSGEPPRLRIEEAVTNAQGAVESWIIVWDELTRQTNYQAQISAEVAATSNAVMTAAYRQTYNQLGSKAPRAWGEVTSAGLAAPPNTVWVTEPKLVIAGGTEYAHFVAGEGTVSVLTANGQTPFTEGAEGQFRFCDESGDNYFGFDVAAGYTIGCRTDGIVVEQSGSDYLVTLTYDLSSSNQPEIYHSTNLTTWVQLDDEVEWEDNPPTGQQVCYINAGATPKGFYKATVSTQASAKFITNMQADLAGGIAATNEVLGVVQSIYPTITSTGVVWRARQ